MSGYAVAQIDEIDEISDGRCPWWRVRHPSASRPSASRLYRQGRRRPDHQRARRVADQTSQEELDLVHRAARGSSSTARPSMLRRARSSSPARASSGRRSPRSRGPRSSRSAARRARHTAHRGRAVAPVSALFAAGRMRRPPTAEQLSADAGHPVPLYNLACCESLAGRQRRRRSGTWAQAIGRWERCASSPRRLRLRPDPGRARCSSS